jgi:hypothetical protein
MAFEADNSIMGKRIYFNETNVVLLRKKLADLESRRARLDHVVPAEVWQEFVEVSRGLEQAEEKIRENCRELAGDVNQIRAEVVSALEQYNLWRKQMRQIEEQFLLNIVRPGCQLKLAIRQREGLERAYQRMVADIQREGYASQQELEADIRQVLAYDDAHRNARDEILEEELDQDDGPLESIYRSTADDVEEAISKEEIIREFKRVVLPKIHPDTSDTPAEVFITVYEVLEKKDPLLMEAYIVEYRGEIESEQEADVLVILDRMKATQKRYRRLYVHLQHRLDRLKQAMTSQELENPKKVIENMQRQREELLVRIRSEAETILYWREKIEGLVKLYKKYHA